MVVEPSATMGRSSGRVATAAAAPITKRSLSWPPNSCVALMGVQLASLPVERLKILAPYDVGCAEFRKMRTLAVIR